MDEEDRKALVTLEQDVKEIKDALLGNEFSKNSGMITEFTDIKLRVKKIEIYIDRARWSVYTLVCGIILYKLGIVEFIKFLF